MEKFVLPIVMPHKGDVTLFRYSFPEAIPIFFNCLKCGSRCCSESILMKVSDIIIYIMKIM